MADISERGPMLSAVVDAAGKEVEAGLPNEQGRIAEALANLDYYEGRNEQHIERRESEDPEDFRRRPKRFLRMTTRVVEILTAHLYNPGPSRRFNLTPAVQEWIGLAYREANAALAEADQMATLNDVALIQVAPTGRAGDPIRFHVWDSSQFTAWTDPDDASSVVAVATIDREDERTRYTLWSATGRRVYLTEKAGLGRTAGGRKAILVEDDANPYGVIPFVVVPYRRQRGQFWVNAPGTPIRKANGQVDRQLSDLAQAIEAHLFPIGVATNADPNWSPVFRPGKFVNVPSDKTVLDGTTTAQARIGYVQATVDEAGTWDDISKFIENTLEMEGLPKAAFRLDQSGAVSGRAIIAEQLPLINRAKQRQPMAAGWEDDLALVTLRVGGEWYKRADLVEAAGDPKLSLTWPTFDQPMPGPEQDEADAWELEQGLASRVDVLMRRRGYSRDEALEALQRVVEDKAKLAGMTPTGPTGGT